MKSKYFEKFSLLVLALLSFSGTVMGGSLTIVNDTDTYSSYSPNASLKIWLDGVQTSTGRNGALTEISASKKLAPGDKVYPSWAKKDEYPVGKTYLRARNVTGGDWDYGGDDDCSVDIDFSQTKTYLLKCYWPGTGSGPFSSSEMYYKAILKRDGNDFTLTVQ